MTKEQFQLSEQDLRYWGELVTRLRADLTESARRQ